MKDPSRGDNLRKEEGQVFEPKEVRHLKMFLSEAVGK